MNKINTTLTALAAGLALVSSVAIAKGPGAGSAPYEVYASDQSNSVAGAAGRGVSGSYMHVWKGEDVEKQISSHGKDIAPVTTYDINDIFPGDELVETGTGSTLEELHNAGEAFGRLHGMLPDPQQKYMNINMFVTGGLAGGYVGIIDGATKKAVALFQVTKTGHGRSLHMSFWNHDGSALLLANLHGRVLERINIDRDTDGNITGANYDLSASVNVGSNPVIVDPASAFNGAGMVPSGVTGSYAIADMGLTTPAGDARQGAERPANVIVCPIVTSTGNVYITMGGGGLLVADGNATPMNIVAEYDRETVNGAGCGGLEVDGNVFLNAGASAAGSGATQSTMTIYGIDDAAIAAGNGGKNLPAPTVLFKDATNTATIGNTSGAASNGTGQLPGITTRRDAHGMAKTLDGRYIHQADRLQNVVEVVDTKTMQHVGSYDLTSANGQGKGTGPCAAFSVTDDAGLPGNDPAPDLMGTTPDGKHLVVATRGPIPVSVGHNAQGSCPGVGVIKLNNKGDSGKLITVLRTYNSVDDAPANAPGGHAYTGNEHSDPHGASVRIRVEDAK
ncbi:MAG: hypothetical protein DIZ80_02625 [endosymbiont of Galathealinum brachiosum]|uniref:Uncharacterized protein n=1 Tax=endosymbiont of Galathealinum brachiosum TaxID=2200906 RepID=A0A370DK09_9GAMM|nr:MAG: hypothetical protein DIZ80_02625 [endosymbiont of Galathealinum brachiosum]